MKVRRLFSALLVLFFGIALLSGCSGKPKAKIEPLQEYYMDYLFPYSFPHKFQKLDDSSFLRFDEDFKNILISFDSIGENRTEVSLVITSCTRKSGQIKGTASRIATTEEETDGKLKLIKYSFWSDKNKIYLKALVTYIVSTAKETDNGLPEDAKVTVSQNMIVAEFLRTAPAYIPGGVK